MRKIELVAEETDTGWGVASRIEGDFSTLGAAQAITVLVATLDTISDDLDDRLGLPRGSMITRATELLKTVEIKHSMIVDNSKPKG